MKKLLTMLGMLGILTLSAAAADQENQVPNEDEKMAESIYEFKLKDIQGKETELDTYKGKVLLIMNTASKCGLTPQYENGGFRISMIQKEFQVPLFHPMTLANRNLAPTRRFWNSARRIITWISPSSAR